MFRLKYLKWSQNLDFKHIKPVAIESQGLAIFYFKIF